MKIKELKHRKDVGLYLNANNLTNFGAEIGVAYGENACDILKKWNGSGLILIDPWDLSKCGEYIDGSSKIDFDGAYNYCVNSVKEYIGRSIILRHTSDEALTKIPDGFLDFCYIDGNHHDPQVSRDISAWYKKVKSGGLFGGHDYYNLDEDYYRCDVKSAVDNFVAKNNLTLHTTEEDELDKSWWVIVP
jgi:hypothetical protein